MAVAWIGSREVSLSEAINEAARLLTACRQAVFSLDTDVHGTRGMIALAERVGAVFDSVEGCALAGPIALHTDNGGFFTTPTEVRRRADMIVLVGNIPPVHDELVDSWRSSSPDLGGDGTRRWFHLQGSNTVIAEAASVALPDTPLGTVIALIRAVFAGRQTTIAVPEIEHFVAALKQAVFPVFVFSGAGDDRSTLAALQGLVTDINGKRRASSLFLPLDDNAWGTVLTSVWMTGFPPAISFASAMPVYDPALWNARRMLAEGEADLHFWLSENGREPPASDAKLPLVAAVNKSAPVAGAAVTFAVGRAGIDHDGIAYSSRIGTFRVLAASAPSDLPSIAQIVRQIAETLPGGEVLPC